MSEEVPTISIIIPTYNAERVLPLCLESISEQDYPKEQIEIIIIDDNSTDSTVKIAKKYTPEILTSGAHHIERSKSIGLKNAKNELVLFLDSDNVLPSADWLKKIVLPFMDGVDIAGAEPVWFQFRKEDTISDRYCSLFGINDPLSFYLKRRDRFMWINKEWDIIGKGVDKGEYFLASFDKKQIPTLGSIGFLANRELLLKTSHDPYFFHMDSCHELIQMGHDKFAMMKLSIIHLHSESIFDFLQKLKRNIDLYLKYNSERKYIWTVERRKLLGAIIIMATVIKPTYDSIKGFLRLRDIAWFLNPFLCLSVVAIYSFTFIKYNIDTLLKKQNNKAIP